MNEKENLTLGQRILKSKDLKVWLAVALFFTLWTLADQLWPLKVMNDDYYATEIRKEVGLKQPIVIFDVVDVCDSRVVAFTESETTGVLRCSYALFEKNRRGTYDLERVRRPSLNRGEGIVVASPPISSSADSDEIDFLMVLSLNPNLAKVEYRILGYDYEVTKHVAKNPSITIIEIQPPLSGSGTWSAEYHFYDIEGKLLDN